MFKDVANLALTRGCQHERARHVIAGGAFRGAGIDVFFEDSASGVKRRPELEKLLGYLQEGDEPIVYKLNPSKRDTDGPADAADAGAFAEFERGMIVERVTAGIAAARERGSMLGRNRRIDYQAALRMRRSGALMREFAEAQGVRRPAYGVH